MKNKRTDRQQGLTLVECCMAVAVAAVALATVAPNLQPMLDRRVVEAGAAQLETDLQHARSLAVARQQTVRVTFVNAAACYVVHTGGANDCRCALDGSASCSASVQALQVSALGRDGRLTLQSNSSSIAFDAVKGTVTPTASVQIASRSGAALRTVVNVMGRVRSCALSGGFTGYPGC